MHEYIQKFKYIELKTKKILPDGFIGNYRSAFKGNGLEFEEFSPRQEGEDISGIDWLISAREGRLLKRRMREERQCKLQFVLDISANMQLPFQKKKSEMLLEIFFMLGLSALKNKDLISSFLFGGDDIVRVRPSMKESSLFETYKKIMTYKSEKQLSVSLNHSLTRLLQEKVHQNMIFVLTDTFDFDESLQKQLAHKNEVVFIHIFNNFENTLYTEKKEILLAGDMSGAIAINNADEKKRKKYAQLRRKKIHDFSNLLAKNGIDYLYIDDQKNIFHEFLMFMKKRENRY